MVYEAMRQNTSVVIIANPDLRVAPDLILYLLDSGIPRENILITRGNDRDQVAAYNFAVEASLRNNVEYCMFADADIRPHSGTDPMLAAPYDFTCAMAETELGMKSWSQPDAFHSGMWIAKREALKRIPGPWFGWTYNPNHSSILACVCESFSQKVKAAGMTIGHAGHAHHWPRGKEMPSVLRLIEPHAK